MNDRRYKFDAMNKIYNMVMNTPVVNMITTDVLVELNGIM